MTEERIRALIIDDEPLARLRISDLLKKEERVDVVGEAGNGSDAVKLIEKEGPDLIFLDVQMPGKDGFGVLEALGPGRMPHVIFVTAYDQYALQAFDVHAMDYLLKPFDRKRFYESLHRALDHIAMKKDGRFTTKLKELLEDVQPSKKCLDRLIIKAEGRIYFVKTEEIDWIEAAGNYVTLHVGKEEHLMRDTMSSMEEKLDPEKFMRIHRSNIVNLERIKEIQPWFNGEYLVILKDDTRLTLSRKYRERFKDLF